jgi:pimeloyl-ACP methyl ester carboxylesterase
MGMAEHHEIELAKLSPRRVVAFTHRGLGKSGKVSAGMCKFEDRVSDIDAVIKYLGLTKYILYGFSRGVALAVAHATQNQNAVRGLILHDCEPIYIRPSEKSRDFLMNLNNPNLPKQTVEAYWHDAQNIDLTERLSEFTFPILFLKGALEGSLLSTEKAQSLLTKTRNSRMQVLTGSAHEVGIEDYDTFLECLRDFCININ